MKIGYARVSSASQDLEIQIKLLAEYGCERIYTETISGKNNNRPELKAMLHDMRGGDTIVVCKIDRIARSIKGIIDFIELINKKDVNFLSLDRKDKLDTTTPMGKTFLMINAWFAEIERDFINSRTSEGREAAKLKGVKFGRKVGGKNKNSPEKYEAIQISIKGGATYEWICDKFKVSRSTVAQIKKKIV